MVGATSGVWAAWDGKLPKLVYGVKRIWTTISWTSSSALKQILTLMELLLH